jgi:hypothetical protein
MEQPTRVTSTALIHFQRNRYSVPCEWVNTVVSLRVYPKILRVVGTVNKGGGVHSIGLYMKSPLHFEQRTEYEAITAKRAQEAAQVSMGTPMLTKATTPMRLLNDALTFGKISLTEKQRSSLGGNSYKPRVRLPDEALPREVDKMNSVYKPPDWNTRTGR